LFSDEDLNEFKVEAFEFLTIAEESLLALDQEGDFKVAFDAIFRGFHNLKGASGMMNLESLQHHTHKLETILMNFKEGPSIPREYIDLFFKGIDAARDILDGGKIDFNYQVSPKAEDKVELEVQVKENISEESRASLDEFSVECNEIIERVSNTIIQLENNSDGINNIDELYRDIHSLKGGFYLFGFTTLGELGHAIETSLEGVREQSHSISKKMFTLLNQAIKIIEIAIEKTRLGESDQSFSPIVKKLVALLSKESLLLAPIVDKTEGENLEAGIQKEKISNDQLKLNLPNGSKAEISSIRVPVPLLDHLMTLVGEMVLVRNQVLQFSNEFDNLEFVSMSKRLNVVTTEIQEEMMKTRMQPVGNVLNKFNRVVRDISNDLDKKITLELGGTDTEIDKSLLEAIKDPLTHIVRNSCDHGIELPGDRILNNKPENGTININAYHESGQVVIDVSDDGQGLDKQVLVSKSIEKGLITQSQANNMSDKEIYNLIFSAGFSTAQAVTNLSGRGVGMDVVKTNIEKIGGSVDLDSKHGNGTSIKIKIPLTLAIVPALLVKSGLGKFAIPQVKLEELVRVDQIDSESRIEVIHNAPIYRLRGNILPLVDLDQILSKNTKDIKSYQNKIINIAVLRADSYTFGLIIDEIQDTADIVVKPVNRLIKSLTIYSGATILGDGSVALILDVLGISKLAKLNQGQVNSENQHTLAQDTSSIDLQTQEFLLLRLNSPTMHGLALNYVNRLEEFTTNQIEYSSKQPVVRYRNHILPLVFMNKELGYEDNQRKDTKIPVVVIEKAGRLYGLVVDEIIDTLSTKERMEICSLETPGIFGDINTKKELIVVIDPFSLIENAFPQLKTKKKTQTNEESKKMILPFDRNEVGKILLAEDTVFFRRSIKASLENAGYIVDDVHNGKEALKLLCQQAGDYCLLVSDIEMPKLNGFELASSIKNIPTLSDLPLLALSSKADNTYREKGKAAGFDVYLEKLRPNELVEIVDELISSKRAAS